jgi:hypothetical protein
MVCLGLLLIASAPGKAEESTEEQSDARARALIKRAAEYLAKVESFSFEAETEYDVLQDFGQTLEFGGTRQVQVRRPDRVHVRLEEREGNTRYLIFDGEETTFYSPEKNVFARVATRGSLEDALEFVVERLDQPAPLAELMRSDLGRLVEEVSESALYVGESTLDGVRCHHLAFAGSEVDWQAWISEGDPPLFHRLVITYPSFEGSPRFRARIRNWNLSAELPDSVFEFEPPEGAVRIPVVAEFAPEPESQGKEER